MNACFVSHSSDLYGAERSLLELIDALRRDGVHPSVILPSDGPLGTKLRARGIRYAIIPSRPWLSAPTAPWRRLLRIALMPISVLRMARQIRRWGCDLVYTNTLSACDGALAAWLVRRPHVWHIHEFNYEDHGLTFLLGEALSLGLVARLSSVCIACSRAVARRYAAYIPAHKLKMIYPSITLSSVPDGPHPVAGGTGAAPVRCVLVGALAKGKRQEDAIRAVAELIHAGIGAELVLVGDSDDRYAQQLRAQVRAEHLERHVEFTGYLDDPLPVVQDATIVLSCSESEAFPRSTIEGMLLGKPVIGTRSGGTVEQIREGYNGLLYTPGDAGELAERIRYLHEHPRQADEMGRNGRRWARERFDQDRYGAEVFALLHEVAAGGRAVHAR